ALKDFACWCNSQKFADAAISCVARECPQAVPAGVQAIQGICASAGQTMSHVTFPATIPTNTTGNITAPDASTGTAASPSPAPPSPGTAGAASKSAASAAFAPLMGLTVFVPMALPFGIAVLM
ncbi:hypothetical protein A4X06_0g4469, partial [Tilletia controversa]